MALSVWVFHRVLYQSHIYSCQSRTVFWYDPFDSSMVQLRRRLPHSVSLYLSPPLSDIFFVLYLERLSSSQQLKLRKTMNVHHIHKKMKSSQLRMHSDCQNVHMQKCSFNVLLCICNKCTKQAGTEIHSSYAFLSTDLRRFDGRAKGGSPSLAIPWSVDVEVKKTHVNIVEHDGCKCLYR